MFVLPRFNVCSALVVAALFFLSSAGNAEAQGYRVFETRSVVINRNGFSPTIVPVGAERQAIRNMHILDRPYRPFHFYGNTVRRRYFRSR